MSKYRIITIEREYASGGQEIGTLVAQALGIPCYGEEVLQMAAERNNTTVEHLRGLEETATNSLIYSLYMMSHATVGTATTLSTADSLAITESEIIRELAEKESCVVIGRCSSVALRDRDDVLRVYIRSDMEARILRAVNIYDIPAEDADSVIRRSDKRRLNYHNANSSLRWNDPRGYHMMLDSAALGIQVCAELIANVIKR